MFRLIRNRLRIRGERNRIVLYAFVIGCTGVAIYTLCQILSIFRLIFFYNNHALKTFNENLVWYSGTPTTIAIIILGLYLLYVLPSKRGRKFINSEPLKNYNITVVLPAYNEEKSIGTVIADFKSHHLVKRVIVVNNNSKDRTKEEAILAGAIVVDENKQGYGPCVYKALLEGSKQTDTDLTLLCESDFTFRAHDIDKFIAYISHVDIVNGTRIIEQLREDETQITTFIYYGNYFVAKLLEMKYIGQCTLSDVGTTYKLCKNSALSKILPLLSTRINHEFNPYFLDTAIKNNISITECPITFYKRIGESKGGNKNNFSAFKIGIRMMIGIMFSRKRIFQKQDKTSR